MGGKEHKAASLGHTADILEREQFGAIYGELVQWRLDPYIRKVGTKGTEGRIFPFARGLRFSARLIYAIRKYLHGSGLCADWGLIVDEDGAYPSKECDIVIHRGKIHQRWNDNEHAIMDFKFVHRSSAIVVISCKSYLDSIDTEYCVAVKPFVDRVWLFAECCRPQRAERLKDKAIAAGYQRFWYLYSLSPQGESKPNYDGWSTFTQAIRELA